MMIRVGYMDFANVYPIFYHLLKLDYLQFTKGVPAELNVKIRNGEIDISPSSSIEFIRNYHDYFIIPDISISSVGKVKSVCLYSHLPLKELDSKKIYFTKQSNTSTVLTRIILEKFYNFTPFYTDEKTANLSAELLIGDDALNEYYNGKKYEYIIDLGQEWHNQTSLPFVFALWIANRRILEDNDTKKLVDDLLKFSRVDRSNNIEFADKYIKTGFTLEQMLDYWKVIDYRLDDEYIKGLELFYRYAHELGETNGNKIENVKKYFYK